MYNYDKMNNKYYSFLKRGACNWSTENIDTPAKKRQYHEILKELVDTKSKKIQCLTEEQTDILRHFFGVYGEEKKVVEIGAILNKTPNQISAIITNCAFILRNRINRGVAGLKEAYLNGEITKEELLNVNLQYIDYPHETRILNSLVRSGYSTIGKLIESSISDIRWSRNTTDRVMKELVNYIHSLGLVFKNEAQDLEGINHIILDKYINNQPYTNPVNTILEDLDEQIALCDEIIETQQEKKEKLQRIKNEILEKANQGLEKIKKNPIPIRLK